MLPARDPAGFCHRLPKYFRQIAAWHKRTEKGYSDGLRVCFQLGWSGMNEALIKVIGYE